MRNYDFLYKECYKHGCNSYYISSEISKFNNSKHHLSTFSNHSNLYRNLSNQQPFLHIHPNFEKMKIISILVLTTMIAIAMEMVRSEYLLVEVDDAEQRGKYILYQHAEFFYHA